MYIKIKRLIDIVISFLGLMILSPLFLILITLIKFDSKGPILFKQKRVGINKIHFNILKFRTMRVDTPQDTPTHLLENPEQWITRIGKKLRKTSLDELPQLINIIKGDMSIVGPRPALWNQKELIAQRDELHVNDILPGLTGWAQVNGRDDIAIKDKVKLDSEYLNKMSLSMDIKCFVKTITNVVTAKGIVEGQTENKQKDKTHELVSK